ncbi:heme ABC exporter ATP-binding protein CcmA [Roseateles sp.]|uniref:heme ABC exporter ATP-binding protein CcmA n=1 Tax=Roseateles sp. TaxID=1971397 RepID=UPI002DFDF0E8|nr:heme ABC exporter ATP-binding protein CcmA [Roseateles sp.]HEV6968338.1 heme ABC exporter ATP-binding protein CcmA [Roseateles sp.]
MTSEGQELLRAEGLACDRGGQRVLSLKRLTLSRGAGLWLRGRNGSGKTTLLRALAGLLEPAAGEVWRDGAEGLLYVGHTLAVKDDLSVAENLECLAELSALETRPRALQGALLRWQLWERRHHPARRLSQGLRRRVSLARLDLAAARPLWLLDEPFDALDEEGQALLAQALTRHRLRQGGWVLSSHQGLPAQLDGVQALWLDGGAAA